MDNPLIYTVNKNLELAMAKYSSITGQLAEMKKKILGAENEKIMTQAANIKEVTPRRQEGSLTQESISREHSNEKISLILSSSTEDIESNTGEKNYSISEENIASRSNETITDSIKSDTTNDKKENIFNELYMNLNDKSMYAVNTKFDPIDYESDDESKSSSCFDNDRTIENLFLEEINKGDLEEKSSDLGNNDKITEEFEGNVMPNFGNLEFDNVGNELKRFDSSKSSCGDIQIPYENIFSSDPLDIETILEEDKGMDGLIKESKKDINSPAVNLEEKRFLELYDNDDVLSVRTRYSVIKEKNKKTTLKRVSSAKQKSYESNINSLSSEIKSNKTKSINGNVKKKLSLRNSVKLKENKKENTLITKKDNLKNRINKESQVKRNEKQKIRQLALLKGIPLEQTKSKSTLGKKMKEIMSVNNIQTKQNQNNFIKEQRTIDKKDKTNKSFEKLRNEKNKMIPKEMKNVTKTPNRASAANTKKNQNKLPPKTPAKSVSRGMTKIDISDQEENDPEQTKPQKEISLSNPKDILSKLEEQILSAKLKEVQNETCQQAKQLAPPLEINKKKSPEKVPEKITLKESSHSKNKVKTENYNDNKIHKLGNKYTTSKMKILKKEENFSNSNKNITKHESFSELQNDGMNKTKSIKKSSLITNIASKSNLINEEKYQLANKNSYITESIGEVHNEILNMNIDDKKTLNFPFILGRSASKSFNIQANIQQITSLVRMLPKDTIQRTLLDENDNVSRASTKVIEMKCPACNEKGCDESDITLTNDPWDNTSKNFIRCTCMSKNTISSKYVLHQLLLQSNFSPLQQPCGANFSQFEEFPDRNIFNQESSNMNLYKRHDLTKLLHATQRFVTNKLVG